MSGIDFDRIESELELVVPAIYKMFMEAVDKKKLDLEKHGISYDTETIISANQKIREQLEDQIPAWKNHYLDVGVGDGCGNYYFIMARKEKDDSAKLWAHDPSGIEKIDTATAFLMDVLSEVEENFEGANKFRFQGNNGW